VFGDSDDTDTATAAERAGKQQYLCPALITGRTIRFGPPDL
jgi:hypothetical protein